MNQYTIETLNLKHISEVTLLFNRVFKKNNTKEYFIKKYFHNDVLTEVFSQVAIYDNVVVSFCGLIPQKFGNDLVGHSCEYFTHPTHRGNGLLQKLFHQTLEKAKKHNMVLISAFFSNASYGAVKQYDWQIVDEFYYRTVHTKTIPITRIYPSDKIIGWQWNKLLGNFKKVNPNQLKQPSNSQKITPELLAYKSYTKNALLQVGECVFWLKLDKVLTIGWVQYKTIKSYIESLSVLKKACRKAGIDRIFLHVNHQSSLLKTSYELGLDVRKSFEVSILALSNSNLQDSYTFDIYNFDTF